jgi:endonuclease/exonuclease/phosphatase family metal-dependent hydrolase
MCRTLVFLGGLVLSFTLLPFAAADERPIKVLSFNIRYATPADGKDQWKFRREMVRDLIRRVGADFVGLQEVTPPQWAYLRKESPGCGFLCRSREKDQLRGEAVPILYRKSRWRIDPKEQGFFWLSEKPEEPGSKSWKTACSRMVTWARFTEKKTNRSVYVYNTHFDHRSAPARREGAKLLARRIADRKYADPVLLTGDLNCGEASRPICWLTGKADGSPVKLRDTFRVVHPKAKDVGTFHGFTGKRSKAKIDYILASPAFRVLSAKIMLDNVDGRYPSDHCPVLAEVGFPGGKRGDRPARAGRSK